MTSLKLEHRASRKPTQKDSNTQSKGTFTVNRFLLNNNCRHALKNNL